MVCFITMNVLLAFHFHQEFEVSCDLSLLNMLTFSS